MRTKDRRDVEVDPEMAGTKQEETEVGQLTRRKEKQRIKILKNIKKDMT